MENDKVTIFILSAIDWDSVLLDFLLTFGRSYAKTVLDLLRQQQDDKQACDVPSGFLIRNFEGDTIDDMSDGCVVMVSGGLAFGSFCFLVFGRAMADGATDGLTDSWSQSSTKSDVPSGLGTSSSFRTSSNVPLRTRPCHFPTRFETAFRCGVPDLPKCFGNRSQIVRRPLSVLLHLLNPPNLSMARRSFCRFFLGRPGQALARVVGGGDGSSSYSDSSSKSSREASELLSAALIMR